MAEKDPIIEALEYEQAGYEAADNDERVKAVKASIAARKKELAAGRRAETSGSGRPSGETA